MRVNTDLVLKTMAYDRHNRISKQQECQYATVADFDRVFNEQRNELSWLCLRLTANPAKAEKVLLTAREACGKAKYIFREWAHSWAKRSILQIAIRQVKPVPSIANAPLATNSLGVDRFPSDGETNCELDALWALTNFERFVFVMSVLERYSEYECALLLGSSRREVEQARRAALGQLTARIAVLTRIRCQNVAETNLQLNELSL
jgi:DNA-directed RNA polymerase specialized sigma24 family protein